MNCGIDPPPVFIWPWCRPYSFRPYYSLVWGGNMSSISCARIAHVDIKANRLLLNAPSVSAAGVRTVVQLFLVALVAASLAACAQSSVVPKKSELLPASRQASLEQN